MPEWRPGVGFVNSKTIYEYVQALIVEGMSREDAFREAADHYNRKVESIANSYHRHRRILYGVGPPNPYREIIFQEVPASLPDPDKPGPAEARLDLAIRALEVTRKDVRELDNLRAQIGNYPNPDGSENEGADR